MLTTKDIIIVASTTHCFIPLTFWSNLYREELNQPNQTVTYKRLADNWFVISGYENNRVFYNKTLLHQGDVLTLSIDYDKAFQPKFDPIVAAISRSFQASQ